ncbi:RNA-binding S4 domain-containing protein [Aestuariirhabdus litorea]|uniref:RNA-binding S4 domain-containing protein n=1 Tax=Aestuariirhabdus litorea TaxID=2528527 RepID=A0A3P3VM11_9GAMM|nr:RNA-binding S4 domain-containing protein [Aestuariirhabdus litorea]RRJ82918.1 RNA-binding S4 domain-containing protein [Aestuariirhabdus litorea]RWW93077.1 RNA-binding S4 domain-containing protein [Endozoicomonadaceae bacterium GTF-13]
MKTIIINREPVELFKILKFEGMVASGADAKGAVAEGQVRVNGEVETRKRRKMMAGDLLEFHGEQFRLSLGD